MSVSPLEAMWSLQDVSLPLIPGNDTLRITAAKKRTLNAGGSAFTNRDSGELHSSFIMLFLVIYIGSFFHDPHECP